MSTKIYTYAARPSEDALSVVREQIRLGQRYRNELVALEIQRRADVDHTMRELAPEVVAAEETVSEAEKALLLVLAERAEESKLSGKRRATPTRAAALKEARAALANARRTLKAARKARFLSAEWVDAQAEVEARHTKRSKAARAASGLYWGIYLAHEQAAKAHRKGPPPRFKRWDGSGKVAVQVQGGLDSPTLLACVDRRLRLEVVEGGVWTAGKRRPRKLGNAIVSLRVGSQGRDPVWARIPIHFHRPLPAGAKVKWAYLDVRRRGTKEVWRVQFVVVSPDVEKPTRRGSVGVDVGWRKIDGQLRVATFAGSDGHEEEVRLPSWWLEGADRCRRIQSYRDRDTVVMRAELTSHLARRMPGWLREVARERKWAIGRWTSAARFAALCIEWREHGGAPEFLEAWRQRDKHLLEYEAHLRAQLAASRLDLYRRVAAAMGARYGTVVVENMDLRDFHKRLPEEETTGRRHLKHAALSVLAQCLSERLEVVKVKASGTTSRCHACHAWNEVTGLTATCVGCGVLWDRDSNAARNILAASGTVVHWTRPPLAPDVVTTYADEPRVERPTTWVDPGALETKRTNLAGVA